MTPNDISVLLHCHCCADPHPRLEYIGDVIDMFLEAELIYLGGENIYKTTEGGGMLVDKLCATSFPIKRWVFKSE